MSLTDKDFIVKLRRQLYLSCTEPKKEKELEKVARANNATKDMLRKVLGQMRKQKLLLVLKDSESGALIFQAVPQEMVAALRQVGDFETSLYQLIDKAGDMGVTKRQLGKETKKHSKIIDNALKTLITKNLIKAVQSIKSKQKVFMKYDVEPNREITGGIWYTENMIFNTKLISDLQSATIQYMVERHHATVRDALKYVKSHGISANVELQEQDMQQIMNTLVYDGLIEESPESRDAQIMYRVTSAVETTNPFSNIPCCNCPVFSDCVPGGDVNPSDCKYLTKWTEKLDW